MMQVIQHPICITCKEEMIDTPEGYNCYNDECSRGLANKGKLRDIVRKIVREEMGITAVLKEEEMKCIKCNKALNTDMIREERGYIVTYKDNEMTEYLEVCKDCGEPPTAE